MPNHVFWCKLDGMKPTLHSLFCLFVFLTGLLTSARAQQQLLIIGDSLSKEYEYEIAGIGGNSKARNIRNWAEILDDKRHSHFDFGSSSTYPDLRLLGHQYNWSIPGSFAKQWVDYLSSGSLLDYIYGIKKLESQLKNEVERVVIFVGGNDIRTNYESIYKGNSATNFINNTFNDIEDIVNWVRSKKPSLQIVLVSVPHIGCTPKTNAAHPYNAVKTGRVTTALTTLNNRLATFASQKKIGFCWDVFNITKGLLTANHFLIGGVKILKNPPNSDGNPYYLFLGDGFHPNQPCQAIFAQRILDTFNAKYALKVPRLTDQEILKTILKI